MKASEIKREVAECCSAVVENDDMMRLVLINTAAQVAGSLIMKGWREEAIGTKAVEIAQQIIAAASLK